MKLLSLIVSLLIALPSYSGGPKDYWDVLLDKYEALCDACMEKKSKKEINLLSESLNEQLKHPEGKMSQAQRERFASIQNKYRGVITFSDRSVPEIDIPRVVRVDTVRRVEHIHITDTVFVKEIIGSIELNQYVHNKDTVYHIIQYQGPTAIEPAAEPAPVQEGFTVQTVKPEAIETPLSRKEHSLANPTYLVLGQTGIHASLSYGAMVGVVDKWGGYAGFHSDFNTVTPEYSCTSDGMTGRTRIMANGNVARSRFAVTAGVLYEVTDWLISYAGAGYGSAGVYWQDINDAWMDVTDMSVKGPEFEAGGIFHLGIFGLSIGVTTTCFQHAGFKVGLGLVF
ncbi:MAG: hypothetical protein Q4G10_06825 [Bacteroidia bacterium]|nr:hypothetical protein [Bacteroidia bacterium]